MTDKIEHSRLPWPKPEYSNDVGPCDEGFWEWWEIDGVAEFDNKADALLCWKAVNAHAKLVAALEHIEEHTGCPMARATAKQAIASLKDQS